MARNKKQLIAGVALVTLASLLLFTPIIGDEIASAIIGVIYIIKYFAGK